MYDLAVRNGKIVDTDIYSATIYIKDGLIAEISEEEKPAAASCNAEGLFILPGVIDTHCHFRDPGTTYKEDFLHGTKAAAVGGVTTVFDMPNTNPAVLSGEEVDQKGKYLAHKAYVDYALWGLSLGHLNLTELAGMKEAGAAAVKFFWGYAINEKTHALVYNYEPGQKDVIPPLDDGEVYEIFEQIARNGQILAIHAENSALIRVLTKRTLASGRRDYQALLEARPALAEVLTIQTALAFAEDTGAHLHVLHVSSEAGVELIRQGKAKGIPVTAETCPHYLFLSDEDYERVGSAIKVYPVIKKESDRQALWQGLMDGTLDFVASDHAPHSIAEKDGDLFSIPSGMCGVESLLPLMLGEVSKGRITLPFVVDVLCKKPAAIYDLPAKGTIRTGADADLVLVDMNKTKVIRNEELHSKEPLTAFDGMEVTGWPVKTFLRGKLIAENHNICEDTPSGRWVRPGAVKSY